ncbi:MAG TPA: hypothetical protein DCZ94_04260 [Lentisphaeria bacterium]|nr:MAG: hypothetical protein A2X48_05480 [Lentisphaerae bacterium GWF2_49_21]HBC86150.1 hypothetical protein [Lentisphaeria bacterium]
MKAGNACKTIFCLVFFMSLVLFCFAEIEKNFKSTLAGRWYPADKAELTKLLDGLYSKAEGKELKDVIALIQPHAGYQYSGRTAFCGIKSLDRTCKRIVIIGPTHYLPMSNVFSVPRYDSFETPLGKVAMDTEFIDKLLKEKSLFKDIPEALTNEHSVQIQVPLLQYDFTIKNQKSKIENPPGFPKIVFIIAGECSLETINEAGRIIKGLMDSETLLLISSDFTHYGASFGFVPFKDNIPEKLKELDTSVYDFIEKKDSGGFLKYIKDTGDTVCGNMPIATALAMLPENSKCIKLYYTTSGEISGDYRNSVSYFSIAFTGKWDGKKEAVMNDNGKKGLTDEEKSRLLVLARKSIVYYLEKGRDPTTEELGIELTAGMKEKRAAFVTLKEEGELRGCIGEIFPSQELYMSVIVHAIAAAVKDRRFEPVRKDEVDKLEIDISALTPPKEVASYKDIKIGTDGMVLKKGFRSAVFLPQVATEQGWNLETTLTHLANKAGLPSDAWKEGANYLTFQAEVFGEEEKK